MPSEKIDLTDDEKSLITSAVDMKMGQVNALLKKASAKEFGKAGRELLFVRKQLEDIKTKML